MKCEKCGYVSFDHNLVCPNCNKDLRAARSKLGIYFNPPEANFDDLFSGGLGMDAASVRSVVEPAVELDLSTDSFADEVEFSLDD